MATFKRAKEMMELAVYRWFKDHVPEEVYKVTWFAGTFSFLDKHGNDVPVPLAQYGEFIDTFPNQEIQYLSITEWRRHRGPYDPVEIELRFPYGFLWVDHDSSQYWVDDLEDEFARQLKQALLKAGYDATIRWVGGITKGLTTNLETGNPLTSPDFGKVMSVIDSIDIDYELYRVKGDE